MKQRSTRLSLNTLSLVTIALGLIGLSQNALAANGYGSCQGFQSDSRRVLYTPAFAAESGAEDAIFTQFVAKLKDDGYVKDTAKFAGICIWEKLQRDVEMKTDLYKRHYADDGANSMGIDFTPAARLANAAPKEDLAKVEAAVARKQAYGWCNLVDFDNRQVYFTDVYSYTGELERGHGLGPLFMADLRTRYREVQGEPVCTVSYSEEWERDARKKLMDQYKEMRANINRSSWKPAQ